jgi:two-component system, NarL family, nitrate/nitrite response regulator NarL
MLERESIARSHHSGASIAEAGGSPLEVPRVYIVSDVRLYRDGLTSVLQGHLKVIGTGRSCDFLDQIATLHLDVLLLDLTVRDSLQIPGRVRQILPALPVVAFAVGELENDVLACAEAGISGYVMHNEAAEDLVETVCCALKGELMCSPRIAALLFDRMATLNKRRVSDVADAYLTRREREIASLIARNLPNKEIARQLRLGPTTVKNHVHNILQKLNIHRRGDVARMQIDGNRWQVDTAIQAAESGKGSNLHSRQPTSI